MSETAASAAARGVPPRHLAPMLVGSMLGALVAGRFETVGFALVSATVCAALAGARPPGRGATASLGAAVLVTLALNAWLTPGSAVPGAPRVMGHMMTWQGLAGGALVALRMVSAIVAARGLVALTGGDRVADVLAQVLAPLERAGLPSGPARTIAGMSARTLPLLRDEVERVGRVQRLRAGRPPRGPAERVRALRAATVPALVGALERADRIALALDARHYRVRPLRGARSGLGSPAGWTVAAAVAATCVLWR
jgi:energy-coupling factor transport system permease protein